MWALACLNWFELHLYVVKNTSIVLSIGRAGCRQKVMMIMTMMIYDCYCGYVISLSGTLGG